MSGVAGGFDPFESCGEFMDFAPVTLDLEDTTMDHVKQALLARMDRMEQNMTFMLKRVFTEIITLRKENAILKSKVQEALVKHPTRPPPPTTTTQPVNQSVFAEQFKCEMDKASFTESEAEAPVRKMIKTRPRGAQLSSARAQLTGDFTNSVIPANRFTAEEDFLQFEQDIWEDTEKEQRLVDELTAIDCVNQEKYIRLCWRKLLADQAAEKFCWRGTATKKSIRDFSVTIALQTAFQQKYSDDGIFERVTSKWFSYAHDRIVKQHAYHNKPK